MTGKEKLQGHVIILVVNVLFAINISVSKSLIPAQLAPEALTLLRILFATAMFWLSSLFARREKVPLRDLSLLFLCACTGIAFNQSLFMAGLNMTSPVDTSIIATAGPIYVMLLAALILKEPITKQKVAGVMLGVAGGALVIIASTRTDDRSSSLGGDMLIVGSNLLYSVYVVISRPLSRRYSAITIMKWMFLFSAVMLTPFMYRHVQAAPVFRTGAADCEALARIAFVLIGGTFVPYLLIPMSLKRLRPTTVSMYNYIQPIVASLLAVMAGQGSFTLDKLVATLLVFTGVYLVTMSKAREDDERDGPQPADGK
ncbi:MAG: DMT family transporter [Tannerella sp.]|jgi:drug/metabolite transporter (DMT)-like permease|nr:DMT family transporter [Tannerella sp.]